MFVFGFELFFVWIVWGKENIIFSVYFLFELKKK
jgi:hypothetical protein